MDPKRGKYLTVYVNEDSRYAARVLEASTLREAPVASMPQGVVRGVSIARDESALAFYSSDGSVPDELYAGKIGTAPSRLTTALTDRMRRDELVVPSVVRFKLVRRGGNPRAAL